MKRNPRKVKWTKAYRRLHGKDMTKDSTFEFERWRHRPHKYDRNVTEDTLKAIKKIDKIRMDRESRHIARRHQGKKAKEFREAKKELDQSISLVKAPSVLKEDPSLTLPKLKVKVLPKRILKLKVWNSLLKPPFFSNTPMADEDPPSEVSVTVDKPKLDETLNVSEVTTESIAQGGLDSSCNSPNEKKPITEPTAQTSDGSGEKSLELAEELLEKGSKAMKDNDFNEAVDCFSRALEIRAAHYGELASECVKLYYKYGCALLYKAQEEADPLGAVPKKEGQSDKAESAKSAVNGESSKASVSSNAEVVDGVTDDVSETVSKKDQDEEETDDSDAEDLADADEDESDLDLAWKMLDVARAIVEKDSADTMEKVDILSALAEVALEREDIGTSLSDYQKALSILERLVEPDNRQLAELNFRVCLCLEFGSQPQEAISYCQKAISICKSRVVRLTDEVKSVIVPTTASSTSGSEPEIPLSSNGSQTDNENAATEKQSEIETLSGLLVELEKKLEDLQQLASNPMSILSEILGIGSAKPNIEKITPPVPSVFNSSQMGSANSNGGFDSPTVSTAHTNGVTHLGVVGRGVKRVSTNSESNDSNPTKKLAKDLSSQDKGDSSSA